MNMRSDKIINTGAVLGLYIYALLAFDAMTFLFANVLLVMWVVDRIHDARAQDVVPTPAPMQEWVVHDDNPSGGELMTVTAHNELEAIGLVANEVYDMYAKPKQPQ